MERQTTSSNEAVLSFLNMAQKAFPEISDQFSALSSINDVWNKLPILTRLSKQEVGRRLAEQCQLPLVDKLEVDETLLKLIPSKFINEHEIAPFAQVDNTIKLAISNPFDTQVHQHLRFITNKPIQFYLAPPSLIEEGLHALYSNNQNGHSGRGVLVIHEKHPAAVNVNAVVALASRLLSDATHQRASDLHIQPFMGGGEIRVRVDGMLHRIALLPYLVYTQLCRYFKANGGMDPSTDKVAQDGRLSLSIDDEDFELRLSVLPAKGGERLVIRFLDQNRHFSMERIRFAVAEIQKIRQLLTHPSGIILLTGPTGSGKTSTLYSLLGELNNAERNILTVENPVEYQLPGISQVEINDKAGLSFASSLRSALRQDPDIIMIGEIRDYETAEIATRAALTGHLVLSTVHTNDAISAVTRLVDLGIQQSVIADSLIGVVSQRLCRQLCPHCRVETTEQLTPSEQLFKNITKIAPAYRESGCKECDWTGYFDRLPVSEVLDMTTSDMRAYVSIGDTSELSSKTDTLNNFASISSSAARRIISGETTPSEVTRILGGQFWLGISKEYQMPIPDLTQIPGLLRKKQYDVILLLSDTVPSELLVNLIESSWMRLEHVTSSEKAKARLQDQTDYISVVVDIPNDYTDEQVVQFIHQARIDMAWCRLPALLLLPEGREYLEQTLINEGATSPCVTKPLTAEKLVQTILVSLSPDRGLGHLS